MPDEKFAGDPPKDVPAPSEARAGVKAVGATCPRDGTLVTCVGTQDDAELVGQCAVCNQLVYANADLVHSVGSLESRVAIDGEK